MFRRKLSSQFNSVSLTIKQQRRQMMETNINYNPFIMPFRVQLTQEDKFDSNLDSISQPNKYCHSVTSQKKGMELRHEKTSHITQNTQEIGFLTTKHHASTIISYEDKRENRKKMKSAIYSSLVPMPLKEIQKIQVQKQNKKNEQFLDLDEFFQAEQDQDNAFDNQSFSQSSLMQSSELEQIKEIRNEKIELLPENEKVNQKNQEVLFQLYSGQSPQSEDIMWQYDQVNEQIELQDKKANKMIIQQAPQQPYTFQIQNFYELYDQQQCQAETIRKTQVTKMISSLKDQQTQTDAFENVVKKEAQNELKFNKIVENIVTKEIKKYKIYKPLKQ